MHLWQITHQIIFIGIGYLDEKWKKKSFRIDLKRKHEWQDVSVGFRQLGG